MPRQVVRATKSKSLWSKDVRRVLTEFVDEYRNGTTADRRELFSKDILPAMRKLYPGVEEGKWKNIKRVSADTREPMPR
jgi:hypothetical protein